MSTELLFSDDATLKTASARVLALHECGIELDRTIFYPLGGGQMVKIRSKGKRNKRVEIALAA